MEAVKADSGSEVSRRGGWVWLLLSVVIILLDQWTKGIAVASLQYQVSVPVVPGLNWTLVHNQGGAFSFLSDHGGWQRWFFLVVSSSVTVVLIEWLRRTARHHWLLCLPLALLIGGAIGNLIDRARLGYVIDFVDVYYGQWHWPAFNVADSGITVGIILLIAYELFWARKFEKGGEAHGRTAG
ncbi:MAG: lipoprotein signal peptidase [Rhodanobacteraceae bacterium]|nr:lipoprotein signal peptidase [Rhodanobacteraceae bacterium]